MNNLSELSPAHTRTEHYIMYTPAAEVLVSMTLSGPNNGIQEIIWHQMTWGSYKCDMACSCTGMRILTGITVEKFNSWIFTFRKQRKI